MTNDGRNITTVLWKVHAALLLGEIGYGGAYILNKMGLNTGVNPLVLAVYREFVVLIFMPPIAYFVEKGQRPPLNLKILLHFVMLGAFGLFASQILVMVGLSMTYAALASSGSILLPVFVFIISAIFRLEEIRWKQRDGLTKLGGMISAVAGALLLPLYKGPVILASTFPGGDLDPITKFQPDADNTLTLLHLQIEAWQVGAILLVLSSLSVAIGISLQGLISSGANSALMVWAIQKGGPVLTAAYAPAQSFATGFMAYVFLGESIHLGSVFGILLLVNGLFLITWGQITSQRAVAPAVAAADGQPIVDDDICNLEKPLLG